MRSPDNPQRAGRVDDPSDLLAKARAAHGRRDWPAAHAAFSAAREAGLLTDADDVFLLADAAWWMGLIAEANAASEIAYRDFAAAGRTGDAAMAAMAIAINCYLRGEEAAGSGWMSRCTRLLGPEGDTPEHGYALYVLEVESQFGAGDPAPVLDAARRVQELGRQYGDPNLVAAGLLGEGRALVRSGEVARGMSLLDEAMVAVLGDELAPEWAGNIYCNLMIACHELGDHRRAAELTDATERWLATMPAAVLFHGICRVHRSQVYLLRGGWEQAEREALRVVADLEDISVANVAEAWYQVGDTRRVRGDLEGAESAYKGAHRLGRDPQPGLALLRLAQGRLATAAASIDAALAAVADGALTRAPLLTARVEIAARAGESGTARLAATELGEIADRYGSSGLRANALGAIGCVQLMEGDNGASVRSLRGALEIWQSLSAPYEAARVRRRLARAYAALGDQDAATLETEAATSALRELGAPTNEPDLAPDDGLSAREREVLVLVATGRTNRQVAGTLAISEKTVARHLSNIFTKLDLESRTQAAAYAFEHGLVTRVRG